MINYRQNRTTIGRLKKGMVIKYDGEIYEIVDILKRKLTDKGVLYTYKVNDNQLLTAISGLYVEVIRRVEKINNKTYYIK